MLVRILFVAIVSLAAPMTAAPASAQDILPVPWAERQPTIADYRSTYPQQALRDGLEGQVRLACTLTEDRALDCAVQSETPAGAGFGEYMLRPALLVAPVLQPGGAARLYLPTGAWYDLWSGERLEGPRFIEKVVPLEQLPLYGREGATLLLGPAVQHTGELRHAPPPEAVTFGKTPFRLEL